MYLYAVTILVSSLLLFLVQPIIAKQILPWFGGTAAVWTTCLVFFQLALLAGYAYSDLSNRLKPKTQTTHAGQLTFPIVRALVSDILTVSDAQLIEAMQFFVARMKIVIEPTGCLAAAAVFGKEIDLAGKRVGVILSGGNVDPAALARYLV